MWIYMWRTFPAWSQVKDIGGVVQVSCSVLQRSSVRPRNDDYPNPSIMQIPWILVYTTHYLAGRRCRRFRRRPSCRARRGWRRSRRWCRAPRGRPRPRRTRPWCRRCTAAPGWSPAGTTPAAPRPRTQWYTPSSPAFAKQQLSLEAQCAKKQMGRIWSAHRKSRETWFTSRPVLPEWEMWFWLICSSAWNVWSKHHFGRDDIGSRHERLSFEVVDLLVQWAETLILQTRRQENQKHWTVSCQSATSEWICYLFLASVIKPDVDWPFVCTEDQVYTFPVGIMVLSMMFCSHWYLNASDVFLTDFEVFCPSPSSFFSLASFNTKRSTT